MAAKGHISRNEQIRRYIEKGLDVEGYSQNIDFIAGIIRQELLAVYHIEDIKAVVEQQANRIAKMHMKSGKIDAAAFFLPPPFCRDIFQIVLRGYFSPQAAPTIDPEPYQMPVPPPLFPTILCHHPQNIHLLPLSVCPFSFPFLFFYFAPWLCCFL